MKRRIADILVDEIARQGVEHVFMLSGGGIMYLADALGRGAPAYVCCRHEQAAAVAAQAYAMYKNSLGVCLVTTGPGGTNALTGCAAAYMDSTPVLFLSGQVKRADFAAPRHVRQFGAQENDIVAVVRPVTKYAVLVEEARDALYELQKAVFFALHGRQGPVWVDVPLDIQSCEIDEASLRRFDPDAETERLVATDPSIAAQTRPDEAQLSFGVQKTLELLYASRRPLMLIGHGLAVSRARAAFPALAAKLGVPVTATWRALGVMDHDDPLFFGSPGLQAVRSANLITQGADFLLVLGSRLDNMITAFSEPRFAHRAAKVIVDVDVNEIAKLRMTDVTPVVCDAAVFLERLAAALPERLPTDFAPWRAFCAEMKTRFPLRGERQAGPLRGADLYRAAEAVSAACSAEDAVVISSTSRCNTAGHIAFRRKAGQKAVSSMGFGSMGFALPSVIGVWFASNGRRVIMLEGDGSLELNIQELQTIVSHAVDAALFVFSNGGYAAIASMQDRNFDGFHVGSDAASGVVLPDLEKPAAAYGLSFTRIAGDDDIDAGVRETMRASGPVLCEIVGDMRFDEIPKCISSVNAQGERVSADLENPWPFLDQAEMDAIYARLPR
jgi:acetolactate synthase-1/2/3 large subunit